MRPRLGRLSAPDSDILRVGYLLNPMGPGRLGSGCLGSRPAGIPGRLESSVSANEAVSIVALPAVTRKIARVKFRVIWPISHNILSAAS